MTLYFLPVLLSIINIVPLVLAVKRIFKKIAIKIHFFDKTASNKIFALGQAAAAHRNPPEFEHGLYRTTQNVRQI